MANPEAQRFVGLTRAEAAQRLRTDGADELPASGRRNTLRIVWDVVREPMFLLLLASGIIYLVLGEARDAAMLLGFVFFIIGITLYQERTRLDIFDPVGRKVLSRDMGVQLAGGHSEQVTQSELGAHAGILLLRLTHGTTTERAKVVLF